MDGVCCVDDTGIVVGTNSTAVFLNGTTGAEPFDGTFTVAAKVDGISSSRHVLVVGSSVTVTQDITSGVGSGGGFDIILNGKNGNIDLTGITLSAAGGDIGLWSSGTVTQTNGALLATGLQVAAGDGAVAGTGGTFVLQSQNNLVSTVSGYAADLKLYNDQALNVGNVDTLCCTLSANTVGLNVTGNTLLTVDGDIGGGFIKSNALIIETTGNVSLTNPANDVTTLAAKLYTNGTNFAYVDANAVNVGSGTGQFSAVTGIEGKGTVSLTGSNVTQSSAILAPNGLAVAGGDATIGNAGNVISQYAANNTGKVSITDPAGIVIGTVAGVTGAKAAQLTLNAGAGNITQTAAIVSPSVTLTNTGDVTLTDAGNDFGTVAVTTGGKVELADANNITVTGVAASSIGVAAGGDVTITSPGSVNMGVISGKNVYITAAQDITDANGKANNITASVQATLIATKGTIVTTPTPELAPLYQGINTPTLSAYAGGITTTGLGSNISIDVWGQVGIDTILLLSNPPGQVYLNGRLIGQQPTGVISAALQTWQNSTGDISMMPPLTPVDYYSTDDYTTGSVREFFENAPAGGITLDATNVHINNGGINLPAGVPASQPTVGMVLTPGGAPMNLPNGTVVSMSPNGDVTITLPTGGLGGMPGSGALASSGALSAVTITPAGIVTGRDGNGLPMAVEGGIAGNADLRGLLDQIADFLPDEYRKRWGLREKRAAGEGAMKVSQL
jgi:hypothetical protein